MWNTSAAYKTEIAKNVIDATWYGTVTLTDGTVLSVSQANIDQNKSKLTRQYVYGETLEIGNAFSSELVLGLRDTPDLLVSDHRYEFYGATINIIFRLYGNTLPNTEAGTGKKYEDVPCGIFTVESAEFTYRTATLTAYDNLNKAAKKEIETKLSNGTAYAGLYALIHDILGLTLATTQAQIEAMPNGTLSWKLSSYKKGTAVKDIIEDICTCICANAMADRNGRIIIKQFNTTSVRTIDDSARYSSNYIDYQGRYTKIALENKDGDEEVYNATTSYLTGRPLTLSIGQNVLLNEKSQSTREDCATDIINSLSAVLYAPCEISIPQDPSIDLGDSLTGRSVNFNGDVMFINTKDEIPLFGQTKMTSAGGNYELANRKKATKVEKKINDVQQQIVDIENNVTIIQTKLSELSGMINVGYILPVEVNTENIEDGKEEDVLRFEFPIGPPMEDEEGNLYNQAASFYSEMCFYIETTSDETTFKDGILNVIYELDGDIIASSAYSYGDGWKILTLNALFPSLEEGDHTFIVRFSMSGGAIANQPT